MTKAGGLTHVQIRVRDLKRSLRFYGTLLGMREEFRVPEEKLVFLRTPGSHDLLTLNHGARKGAGAMGGISHFGFLMNSPSRLEKALAKVGPAGGRVLRQGRRGREAYVFVADPDGYTVELYTE